MDIYIMRRKILVITQLETRSGHVSAWWNFDYRNDITVKSHFIVARLNDESHHIKIEK